LTGFYTVAKESVITFLIAATGSAAHIQSFITVQTRRAGFNLYALTTLADFNTVTEYPVVKTVSVRRTPRDKVK
jgi:hypothetical protein